ncbi:MAG: hypothetical protein LUD72_08160 [Bacteroidales bacterium]|nr:hypothetical protein [Bacteroidales bacterium]
MKKKKLFSVFAVALIAIFSVGCVFAAACGKKDEEEPEAEHVHEYTKVSYDGDSHWYECSAGDGAIDESTRAPHEWDNGTQTTDPTCGEAGVKTYKCECGATKTESVDPTGEHTFTEAVFTWTEDTENGGYTATASLTCKVCGTVDSDNAGVTAVVTSAEEGNNTVYTATVTLGGKEYKDEKVVGSDVPPYDAEKNVYKMSLDFSEDATYGWMVEGLTASEGAYTLETSKEYTSEIVTYTTHSSGNNTINAESAGALFTAGTGSNFKIDLTGLEGDYITVTAKFSANSDDTGTSRYLYVNTEKSENGAYKSEASTGKTDYRYLDYGQEIGEEDTALYVMWRANVRIFELEINIYGDAEPDLDVETPDVVAAEVDTAVMSFTSAGNTATANASYTVNGESDAESKYTASVESSSVSVATADLANGVITVTSVASGTAYITYSVSDGRGEIVASAEIYVAVDTGFVSYDGETETYTAEYIAVAGADGGTFVEFGTQGTSVFANNCTGYNTKAKSTEEGSVSYSDYAETRSNKYITITVPDGATATITAYVSHTSKASRSAYLGSTLEATAEGSYINAVTMGTTDASPSNLYVLSGTNLTAGTYYIYGTDATVHTYAVIVTYTYGEAATECTHDSGYVTKYLTTTDGVETDGWYLVCSICGEDVTALTEGTAYDFAVETAAELEAALGINKAVIKLEGDIVGQFTVTGTEITLELNGHSITDVDAGAAAPASGGGAAETQYTITVTESASLEVVNNGGTETYGIFCTYVPTNQAPYNDYNQNSRLGAAIYTKGTLTVESGLISSTSVGILAEEGTVTFKGGTIKSTFYTIFESQGDVTVNITGGFVEGDRGIFVGGDSYWGYGDYGYGDSQNKTTLNISGTGTYISASVGSAISTLGTAHTETVEVKIEGGQIIGRENDNTVMPAVYMPAGKLTITGGYIRGSTALEVRAGTIEISGGTFVSTVTDGAQNTPEPTGNTTGAVSYGYSLAIYPYAAQEGLSFGEEEFPLTMKIEISGGNFRGPVYLYGEILDEYQDGEEGVFSLVVSGGYFSVDPTEVLGGYVADGKKFGPSTEEDGYFEVVDSGEDTYIYDFTDLTLSWTRTDDYKIVCDADGILTYVGGENTSIDTTGKGLYTGGAKTTATNEYYMVLDLEGFKEASCVTVSVDVGGESATCGFSSALNPWGQASQTNSLLQSTKQTTDATTGMATITYEVDFSGLTDDTLYLLWNKELYIVKVTITVVW